MSLASTGPAPALTDRASGKTAESEAKSADSLIRAWMAASAVAVVLTLVVGGVTRLTESGLSITEWKPISGIVPPLSLDAWQAAYERYLQIPQAMTVHQGITLAEFRVIFWWEWLHRVVARVAGLVIALPYLGLLLTRRIPQGLHARLLALPLLTAAQGVLGWYMVSSGLSVRSDVSQYRLVAHLGLALVIYVVATWTALTLRARQVRPHRGAIALAALAFLTILSGGFVAGLDAGHIYNTFPLMGDGIVPVGYAQLVPAWRNWFENPAAVQFNHRFLATFTLVAVAAMWSRARTSPTAHAWSWVLAAAAVQVLLGILTLLLAVPVPVAALHQLGAVALLTAALWAASRGTTRQESPITS